jgi:hypothetical protein
VARADGQRAKNRTPGLLKLSTMQGPRVVMESLITDRVRSGYGLDLA